MAAAGLAVKTVYGAQPYWPVKKLRICITGADEALRAHAAAATLKSALVASRQAPAASSPRTWRSG